AEAGGASMVRVCDGRELPKGDKAKTYLLRTLGKLAHEMWDVTDPSKPVLITTIVKGLDETHKNWWECNTGIAYLVSDGRPRGCTAASLRRRIASHPRPRISSSRRSAASRCHPTGAGTRAIRSSACRCAITS